MTSKKTLLLFHLHHGTARVVAVIFSLLGLPLIRHRRSSGCAVSKPSRCWPLSRTGYIKFAAWSDNLASGQSSLPIATTYCPLSTLVWPTSPSCGAVHACSRPPPWAPPWPLPRQVGAFLTNYEVKESVLTPLSWYCPVMLMSVHTHQSRFNSLQSLACTSRMRLHHHGLNCCDWFKRRRPVLYFSCSTMMLLSPFDYCHPLDQELTSRWRFHKLWSNDTSSKRRSLLVPKHLIWTSVTWCPDPHPSTNLISPQQSLR